jgi:hypothetical protein
MNRLLELPRYSKIIPKSTGEVLIPLPMGITTRFPGKDTK